MFKVTHEYVAGLSLRWGLILEVPAVYMVPAAFSALAVMASRIGIYRTWGWWVALQVAGRRRTGDNLQVLKRIVLMGEIGEFM